MLTFSQADVEFMESFGKFLIQKTKMELTIPEAIQLNKFLAQYNQITKKIDSHVMELVSVKEPAAEAAPSKQSKSGK